MSGNGIRPSPLASASARVPGTCGELVQGMIGGKHFHITCPIDMYSTATVELFHGGGRVHGPQDSPKAMQAVRLTLERLGQITLDARLSLESPLPRGKGMASSTADVAAAIAATSSALGTFLPPEEIGRLALKIEPSDGVMFPGIVAFDHRTGSLYEPLGAALPLAILVLDFGGIVDTLAFNASDRTAVLTAREPEWRNAWDLVQRGLTAKDVQLVGKGSTLDTRSHTGLPMEKNRTNVLELAAALGAVGVNTGHSGTVFGILLSPDARLLVTARDAARRQLPGLEEVYSTRLVDGGVTYLETGRLREPNAGVVHQA